VEVDVGHERHAGFARDGAEGGRAFLVGQETRTMSAPASSSWRICSSVAAASVVGVLVMDWTEMGASPPTRTDPTRIWRERRRWIARQGRT
jgi:hypothetical protein